MPQLNVAFQAMLDELGPEGQMPDGKTLSMKIEPWPGGRWYRDLGNNAGHFWGHVQVIKPPTLLELTGPMPMSYPAVNHRPVPLQGERRRDAVDVPSSRDGANPARASRRHAGGLAPLAWSNSRACRTQSTPELELGTAMTASTNDSSGREIATSLLAEFEQELGQRDG